MSDKTNINKNEDALENATSENKEQNAAALDAAHIAYLVYARKYRKKLQSEKKKTEKSSEGENEPKDEKKTEGGAELSGLAAEPQKEEKNVPSVSEADTIPESAYDGVASADIPAAEESAESAEPITETEEKVVLPDENNESECQKAPAGEAMPKAVDPELDMIITIDSEPEANKNGEECADELDMTIKIGEPEPENEPKTENPPFFGFGAPTLPEKAPSAEFDGDDGKIMLNIEEQIKTDENIININGRVYPEAAFSSLMRERAAIDKMIDDHYRAYAAEMERLRQKHMFLRMDATARAAAERSEEFKLLQKEEERYKREVAELEERRDSAAKAYIDRKAELERIIGEYDARNEELSDAGSAMQRIASGAADVTAAIANGLAAASFDNSAAIAENAVANARIEHERAMAEATLQKERALAEAKLEAEKRALAEARLEAERAQANARMKDLERDIAAKSAPQGEAKPMSQDAEIRAENTEPEKEKEGRHVVVPGDIDKAYDDAELQKKLSEYRKQQKKQADVELQNLSAYIAAANRDISAIEKEYDELWSRQPESDAERVVNAVERLGARRRVVEKMTDKLLACREAGAPVAVCEKHRDELREAVAQYNSVVDEYKELTGHSLTRAQTDMAERVLRGEEYRLLPVITARREVVSKEDGRTVDKISPDDERAASLRVETVVGSERQLTARSEEKKPAEAAKREEKVVMSAVTMTAKEIPSFFKKQKQREDKLIERESVLASLRPESTEDRVVVLVERLGTERELIASFSKDLKLAVRTRDKGRIRTYKKQLRSHLEKYNRLAGDYKKITGDTLTPADVNIPEYIVNGEKYRALPVISYRKESPDGALLSDQMGAGTTCGAAYALIPEKQRRALEKRGIIEKTRSTSITGLSKKEAKERLKAEKAALREQAQALAASADENARKSKEEAKLAKRGT